MAFTTDTRRALVGSRVEIECLKGVNEDGTERVIRFIRPKKLPQGVADRIAVLQASVLAEQGAITKVKALAKANEEKRDLTDQETEDAIKIMHAVPKGMNDDVARLSLEHGVAEHNLTDDDKPTSTPLSEEAIEECIAFGPLAMECTAIIARYNAPLASGSSGSSKKSSSGSSGKSDSMTTPSSRTEPTL